MSETDVAALQERRLRTWRQTPETRLAGADDAVPLIERAGVVTLFPASTEIPNLYHAYMGSPDAGTDSQWDSPSGEVYTWRWTLGRRAVAFYTAVVRGRPTWVSWPLLPAVIRLRGELHTPDELIDSGQISSGAYRITQALEAAGGVLETGELRRAAGFPTGKEQRAAYLKAVAELDNRLMLAKVFTPDDEDMRHALVAVRYPEHLAAAERMSDDEALRQFLLAYLPCAAYAAPTVLARHLALPEATLRAGLERLAAESLVKTVTMRGQKGACSRLGRRISLSH